VDIIKQLQVLLVEVGAHANPMDSSGALGQLRRRRGGHLLVLRPELQVRSVDFGLRRVVVGGAMHEHGAAQGGQGCAPVDPAALGLALPIRDARPVCRQLEGRRVHVQRGIGLAPFDAW